MRTACTLLDTGGDLLVREPCRHRTADLSKAKLSAVRSHPLLCCRAGVASAQGVLPTVCRNSGCLALSTTCCKYQWSEGGPLDFSDMLLIGTALLLLVSMVAGYQLVRLVGWGAWVEDTYIKKCLFKLASIPRNLLH